MAGGVHLAVGLVLGGIERATEYANLSNPLTGSLFFGLVLAQVGLLGVWLASSSRLLLVKLVAIPVALWYLSYLYAVLVYVDPRRMLGDFIMWVGMCGEVTMFLLLVRCLGFEVGCHEVAAKSRAKPQFSVRQIMVLTMVAAGYLTFARWTLFPSNLHQIAPILFMHILPFAVVAAAAAVAILGARHLWLGVVALFGVAFAAAMVMPFGRFGVPNLIMYIRNTFAEALTLALTLGVLRFRGYRLRRRRR